VRRSLAHCFLQIQGITDLLSFESSFLLSKKWICAAQVERLSVNVMVYQNSKFGCFQTLLGFHEITHRAASDNKSFYFGSLVQVFRSIDSGSVKGFPKISEEVQQQVRPSHVVHSQRGCHYMEKIGRFECISNSRGLGNQILLCCTDLILNIPV
jgi:hypothetical protein